MAQSVTTIEDFIKAKDKDGLLSKVILDILKYKKDDSLSDLSADDKQKLVDKLIEYAEFLTSCADAVGMYFVLIIFLLGFFTQTH